MPRSIDGQGLSRTRYPLACSPSSVDGGMSSLPSSSTIFAEIPGSGVIADPGLVAATPGSGEIIAAPASVCHQVSTTGVLSPPMTFRYQRHASGLIGSPSVANGPRPEQA